MGWDCGEWVYVYWGLLQTNPPTLAHVTPYLTHNIQGQFCSPNNNSQDMPMLWLIKSKSLCEHFSIINKAHPGFPTHFNLCHFQTGMEMRTDAVLDLLSKKLCPVSTQPFPRNALTNPPQLTANRCTMHVPMLQVSGSPTSGVCSTPLSPTTCHFQHSRVWKQA